MPPNQRPFRNLSRRTLVTGAAAAATLGTVGPVLDARADNTVLRLASNGATTYRILVSPSEHVVTRTAAAELSAHLQQVTGAAFPVIEADTATGDLIVIGNSNAIATRRPFGQRRPLYVDLPTLGEDGFAYRTMGRNLVIIGARPRGNLFGVYWLLDRLIGLRWYSAEWAVVPNRPTLELPSADLNRDERPRFSYRHINSGDNRDPRHKLHNLTNAPRLNAVTADIDDWNRGWPELVRGTFNEYITDPALRYGQQILMMSPATRTAAVTALTTAIENEVATGRPAMASFYENDRDWDPVDAASAAFAAQHGGRLSAPMIDMQNEIAQRLAVRWPDVRLGVHAYRFGIAPPDFAVDPHIVVTLADIYANFAHGINVGDNVTNGTHLANWSTKTQNMVFWDYLVNAEKYLQAFPNYWTMGERIKQVAAVPNVTGYFGEHADFSWGGEFGDLRIWVVSRLLWDPDQDVDALIQEFVAGYYGPAAPHIYAYMRLMEQSIQDNDTYLVSIRGTYEPKFLNHATMIAADKLMDQAEAAVAGNARFLKHVRLVRLNVDFTILLRIAEFEALALRDGISWNSDHAGRLARFKTDTFNYARWWEATGKPWSTLYATMELPRVYAPPPAIVAGLPADDWATVQEMSMMWVPSLASQVVDPQASDHIALKLVGTSVTWGVQLDLLGCPGPGPFRVFANVRVEADADVDPAAIAFVGGVYPRQPTAQERQVPFSYFADGNYHEVELTGTIVRKAGYSYIYLSGGSAKVRHVYIDRLTFIKA